MKFWWLFSINALVYMLRPGLRAAMAADTAPPVRNQITNCWREAQRQGYLYPVPANPTETDASFITNFESSQNFLLTRENIAKIVGGNAQDCEQHIDVIMRASHLHAFAEDVFTALIAIDKKFKISFDAPEPDFLESYSFGKSDDAISHVMSIKPGIPNNHLVVFHEGLHQLLQEIEQRYFGTSEDPGKIIPDFDQIKKEGDAKFNALFKVVMKKYTDGTGALSDEELKQFNHFAQINQDKFQPIINRLVVMTPTFDKKFQVGYGYKLSDIMPGELPVKITVSNIQKLNNGHAYVFFKCESPLAAILTNYRISQKESDHGYSKNRKTEENIIRIFDLPLEFIQALYDDALETLQSYIQKMLSADPPQALTDARGHDSTYVFGHERFIMICEKVGFDKLDADAAYTLAHNITKAEDTEYAHKAMVTLARILKDPTLKSETKVSMLLCLGELSYLVKDMQQACSAYAKVAQYAPAYFDNNPPFHDAPLRHYQEAAKKIGVKLPAGLEEKSRRIGKARIGLQ